MNKLKSIFGNFFSWVSSLIIAIFISLFIVSNIVTMTQIKELSMEPTLFENERVVINRAIYYIREPQRGEVVILNKKPVEKGIFINMVYEVKEIVNSLRYRFTGVIEKNILIKRVIAIPGDTIAFVNGQVEVNGIILDEEYAQGLTYKRASHGQIYEIPEGMVFVMGDNRERSLDSREFGPIYIEQIKGRAEYIFYPFDKMGKLR